MKSLLVPAFLSVLALSDMKEVSGTYVGTKDDYYTQFKLYDDSVFSYTASREFPFEVSEGIWYLKGDTVVINSVPCKDPEALQHIPVRTYKTFENAKYIYRKNTITPLGNNNKPVKSEVLEKQ